MVDCPKCGKKMWKMGYAKVDPETDEEIEDYGSKYTCFGCGYVEGDDDPITLKNAYDDTERKADEVIKELSKDLNHNSPALLSSGELLKLSNGFYVLINVGRKEEDIF